MIVMIVNSLGSIVEKKFYRKKKTMIRRANLREVSVVILSVLTTGILFGCAKSASSSNSPANSLTYITVMNLAPYSPAAEVFLNGTQVTGAILPGNYSGSYAHLTPNSYDVKFETASDSVLGEIGSSSYDTAHFYTLILYNDSIHGPAKAVKIFDDFSTITLSNSYIRFMHMCLELPGVDLYINGSPVQQNRVAKDNVTNETFNIFQPVPAGAFTLQVKKAGTDSVLGSLNSTTLAAGNAYTVFLSGSASSSSNPISLNILQAVY
jgi:hypothetical protein